MLLIIYFTSDFHFGHENAIKFTNRPFADVMEMEKTLINNFNKIVNKDDTVYILGDVSYRISAERAEKIIQQLNGYKTLLMGNHDKNYNPALFEEICIYKHIHHKKQQISLMHYPMLEWRNSRHGSIQLHGHIHSYAGEEYNLAGFTGSNYNQDNKELNIRRYDVGVDANNFKPVSILQVLKFFEIEAK